MKVAVKALLQKYSIWIYGVLNFRFIKESWRIMVYKNRSRTLFSTLIIISFLNIKSAY